MVIILLSGTAFMIYLIIERVTHRRITRQNLEMLDNFPIFNFDSTRIHLSSNRKSILVYFDSGCDHCLYELNQIFVNKNSFYLVEHAMRPRRNSFVPENAARHNGADRRLVVFHNAHLHS